jgi:hypothetical protein
MLLEMATFFENRRKPSVSCNLAGALWGSASK